MDGFVVGWERLRERKREKMVTREGKKERERETE